MKWHGGKGDKNRTADYKAYTDNFDKIFRKKPMNEAKVTKDIYGVFNEIDVFEEDTITWKEVDNGMIEIKVVKEAPFLYGEAGGRAGQTFAVTPDRFDKEYKPHLK